VKDFDVDRHVHARRDRDFRIAGEEFRVVASARPETIDGVSMTPASSPDWLSVVDATVCQLLEGDGPDRWRVIRERTGDEALNLAQIDDVLSFCMEAVTGRPPKPPTPSTSSRETPPPGTFSTVGSFAQVGGESDTSTPES
jgi:hypothetical protein